MENKKIKLKIKCNVCDKNLFKHTFKGKFIIKNFICSNCFKKVEIIPHNCYKCGRDLYFNKDNKNKNYLYIKGKYICRDCFNL